MTESLKTISSVINKMTYYNIVILFDGCEELEPQFCKSQKNVKTFLSSWFRDNRDNLEEAVISFLPLSSRDREEIVFDLIQRFLMS